MRIPTQDSLLPTPSAPKRRRSILVRVLKWTLASVAIIAATPFVLAGLVLLLLYFESGPTESTDLVRFHLPGRGFAIPDNYQPSVFSYAPPAEPYAFEIIALLPNFSGYSKERRKDWFSVGTGAPSLRIYVHSSARTMRPDELIRSELEDAIDKNGQAGPAGLRRYDIRDGASSIFEIVYVPEQPGDVIYIGCHINEGAIMNCQLHAIYDDTATFDVSFGSDHLVDWPRIAAGTRRLLKSFQTY
jgi:hypothetical protein